MEKTIKEHSLRELISKLIEISDNIEKGVYGESDLLHITIEVSGITSSRKCRLRLKDYLIEESTKY